jgi:hypothetical protein
MRPADHPAFFHTPPPEGRSRESTIRLDGEGRFWHDGAPVEHAGLRAALHSWIGRHPDDGRYILNNGYDWTYFSVDDVPFIVQSVALGEEGIRLRLSDGSSEAMVPGLLRVGHDGALRVFVKHAAAGGPYDAKFSRHAQGSLGPVLVETEGGGVGIRLGDRVFRVAIGELPAATPAVSFPPATRIG